MQNCDNYRRHVLRHFFAALLCARPRRARGSDRARGGAAREGPTAGIGVVRVCGGRCARVHAGNATAGVLNAGTKRCGVYGIKAAHFGKRYGHTRAVLLITASMERSNQK